MTRCADLSRARSADGLSEVDCQIWLGVSLATLERIEAGEVEPDPELAARIDRFLQHRGGAR